MGGGLPEDGVEEWSTDPTGDGATSPGVSGRTSSAEDLEAEADFSSRAARWRSTRRARFSSRARLSSSLRRRAAMTADSFGVRSVAGPEEGCPAAADCGGGDEVRRSAVRRGSTRVQPSPAPDREDPVAVGDATGGTGASSSPWLEGRLGGAISGSAVSEDGGATVVVAAGSEEPTGTTERPKDFSMDTNCRTVICSIEVWAAGAALTFWAYDVLGWASLYCSRASRNVMFLVALMAFISLSRTY